MKKTTAASLILSVVFCFILNMPVYAEKYLASVDGKSFTSVQDAVDSMKNGQTLTLLSDVKSDSTVRITAKGRKICLNFAGKKYIYTGTGDAFLISSGTVICKGMKIQSKHFAFRTGKNAAVTFSGGSSRGYILNKGTMKFKGGTYTSAGCAAGSEDELVQNYGKLTIDAGTFSGIKDNALYGGKGSILIRGGTFKCSYKDKKGNYYPVFLNEKGSAAVIRGGKFSSPGYALMNAGKVTLAGGSFHSTYEATIWNKGTVRIKKAKISHKNDDWWAIYNVGNMTIDNVSLKGSVINETTGKNKLTINGGTFTPYKKKIGIKNYKGTTVINGGKVKADQANALYNDKDGKLTVTDGTFYSGGSYYALYNLGTAKLNGGSFRIGGTGCGIGSGSEASLKKAEAVNGDVYYENS